LVSHENVNFYASDDFYNPSNVILSNLKFNTFKFDPNEKECT